MKGCSSPHLWTTIDFMDWRWSINTESVECGGRASLRAPTPLWLPGLVILWSAVAKRVCERRHRFGFRDWQICGVRWQSESASADTALASGTGKSVECGGKASLRATTPLWLPGLANLWSAVAERVRERRHRFGFRDWEICGV